MITRRGPASTSGGGEGGGPPSPPRCLALTGGIGAGKSAALEAFARLGARVLSADDVVHRLHARPDVAAAVAERFGRGVLGADGAVDRRRLGAAALTAPGGMAFLEGLLHPRIGEARAAWVAAARAERPPPPLLVCEVPLLFEVGAQDDYDAVLVVTASEAVRRARVAERGQDFDGRAARQRSEADKVAGADRSFVNDGSREALDTWVAERFAEYRRPAP